MKRTQSGFTMIELIVVIVILGILAATALPKFVNLSSDAKTSAMSGMAGSASSAMSVNYAGCAAKNFVPTNNVCIAVTKCSDVRNLIQGSNSIGLSTATPQPPYSAYDASSGTTDAAFGSAAGDTATCYLANNSDTTVTRGTFTAIRTQ